VTQTPVAAATAAGWLLQLPPAAGAWQPLTPATLMQVNWPIVVAQGGTIATLMLLCAISVLLNSAGIELMITRDLNLNRELRAAGMANLLSGLGSGMAGYQTLSDSALLYKMGINSRGFVLLTTVPFFGAMVAGSSILSLFPKPVLGGLLVFLGLSLLKEWLYDTWPILPKSDFGIVLLIFGVMVSTNFLWGIGVGLLVAIALFVVNYSQINVVKHTLSGATYQSNAARSVQQQRLLHTEGDQICILELQGFLFFGTANTLLNQICQRSRQSQLRFVVFSFRLVTGLDSSAVLSFAKLKQIAQQQQFSLVFTHVSPSIQQQLAQGEILQRDDSICQCFPDLDRGIEWCENQILEAIPQRRRRSLPLALHLNDQFTNSDHVADFMTYLEKRDYEPGDTLFHQGELADALYLIELGQVTLQPQIDDQTRRLQSLGAGNLVGEMDFFSQNPHSESAVVDQPSTLYRLSHKAMRQMQHDQPEIAATFQDLVIRLMSDRLVTTYKNLDELLR
jgi:sulfate permease, SulP family